MTEHQYRGKTKELDPIKPQNPLYDTLHQSSPSKNHEEHKYQFDNRKTDHNELLRQNSYREPLTHVKNKSAFESVLSTCFNDFDTKLTYNQLLPFYQLKEDANILFGPKDTDYDSLFIELWEALTEEKCEGIDNERWKYYGFQNANPRSDLRGGGLLALKQLVDYSQTHKHKVREMTEPQHEFLFAVSSINITYFLFRYYHMSDLLTYEKDWKEICSRVALKSFCTMLEADTSAFDKIHAMLLEDLFAVWLAIRKEDPNASLMDFGRATETVKQRYREATMKKILEDYDSVKIAYNKKKLKIPPIASSPHKLGK